VAIVATAAALLCRYALGQSLGLSVPYLQFYPAIFFAAWFGGFGPGVVATALAAVAAMYFFLPPAGFGVSDPADLISLAVFVATGLFVSWLNERVRLAENAQRTMTEMATARAERLDAILNTTADGIIVIDARGTIEAFNRGAQALFGYPEAEVMGRNVVLYWRAMQPEARITLPLSLVAAIPGTYTGPASRAYLYYTAEHKQWVDGLKVEIKPVG